MQSGYFPENTYAPHVTQTTVKPSLMGTVEQTSGQLKAQSPGSGPWVDPLTLMVTHPMTPSSQ